MKFLNEQSIILFFRNLILLVIALLSVNTFASDHDDGEIDLKGRALNLTDLFVFREDSQTGNAAHSDNLILIMNSNPRSVPGQQYYFSSHARYEFHLSRKENKNQRPDGEDHVKIQLSFSRPNEQGRQKINLTMFRDGKVVEVSKTISKEFIYTSTLKDSQSGSFIANHLNIDDQTVSIFAGLREDPFYFDVQAFFKGRAAVANGQSFTGFRSPDQAVDFASDYNVNSIVLRVPIKIIQSELAEKVFDVWATISVRKKGE